MEDRDAELTETILIFKKLGATQKYSVQRVVHDTLVII